MAAESHYLLCNISFISNDSNLLGKSSRIKLDIAKKFFQPLSQGFLPICQKVRNGGLYSINCFRKKIQSANQIFGQNFSLLPAHNIATCEGIIKSLFQKRPYFIKIFIFLFIHYHIRIRCQKSSRISILNSQLFRKRVKGISVSPGKIEINLHFHQIRKISVYTEKQIHTPSLVHRCNFFPDLFFKCRIPLRHLHLQIEVSVVDTSHLHSPDPPVTLSFAPTKTGHTFNSHANTWKLLNKKIKRCWRAPSCIALRYSFLSATADKPIFLPLPYQVLL